MEDVISIKSDNVYVLNDLHSVRYVLRYILGSEKSNFGGFEVVTCWHVVLNSA